MLYTESPKDPSKAARKIRIPDLLAKKQQQRKIHALTCYDAAFGRLLEKSAIDVVLVGDSLGHVVQGRTSTIPVSTDEICYHVKCVAAACHRPLLVADIPFGAAGLNSQRLFEDAEKIMRAGAEAVKIEGASPEICAQISQLTRNGIPVMGHIGLIPQSLHALGGYKIQGKSPSQQDILIQQAKALEAAGCFAIVLELVAPEAASAISQQSNIPTIGIGSGKGCHGQILVLHDMLGVNLDFKPKFLKNYAELQNTILNAVENYCNEVEEGQYPGE